ncbi:type III-A CRISPR-associated RAMP protein Csm5 [Iningainema tapete]|uniref:CRISPR system Cms protein Csm5 n=1 Tax=Iningainema tapete BLCC-T55 TaxID=2748662 RepID=A0A8J7CB43_9CYAN|nr:type III-A CRISPR-associated RAMP protein Csm5 [Iningainema tapete]MBD2777901.1 type III-A CRISPR-associated RAMP protein Csm5 [Iningainema tapete BLCC-T55]
MIISNLALKKPDVYESRRIRLESPILHIGSAVSKLNPFEYVQANQKVYFPNEEALAKGLQCQGGRFLDDYILAIESRQDISKLLRQAFGYEWWDAIDADGVSIFPQNAISQKLTEAYISDLRPMIRNGMGQLFVPGSSIKGAIRTAIAYHLLKAQRLSVSEIEKTLRQRLGQVNHYQQKFLDDDFMDSLFSDFSLVYQERKFFGKGQNTDFLRVLKVSDSEPLLEEQISTNIPVVAEVLVTSRFPDYLAKYRASIYVEMVRNVQTEFTLSLDTEMLSWFKHKQGIKLPFSTLDELVQICQEFTQEQWKYEQSYWQQVKNNSTSGRNLDFNYIREFYAAEKCPYTLRLGWGSGMMGTTVDLLLDDELRKDIRDTCGLKASGFEAPKSRRTVMNFNGEIRFVPGWVKFQSL